MKFLEKFRKTAEKIDGVNLDLIDPTFWLDFGNHVINKILSGSYTKGMPQGRIAGLAGASGSGKSFVASNVVKHALSNNIGVLYIDTENAIHKGYFEAIGVDVDNPLFIYADCSTLANCTKVVSTFVKEYRTEKEIQPFLIVIDSLDMLQTEGDADKYAKGESGGDQGQWAKQCKKMLGSFVQDIKRVNIAMLCTKQVYINQDQFTKFEEPLKFTDSLKFAFTQIAVMSRLRLKDEEKKDDTSKGEGASSKFKGINLQVYGQKTRFTEPFQKCVIEVPYEEGMDHYSGILEAAVANGIITKGGAWYTYKSKKWQGKDAWSDMDETIKIEVLRELIKIEDSTVLSVQIEGAVADLEGIESPEDTVKRRQERAIKQLETIEGEG